MYAFIYLVIVNIMDSNATSKLCRSYIKNLLENPPIDNHLVKIIGRIDEFRKQGSY